MVGYQSSTLNDPLELGIIPIDGVIIFVYMTEEQCTCCGGDSVQHMDIGSSTDQQQQADSVLTTELPEKLGSTLGRFLGIERVSTVGGWVSAVRYHIEGDSVSIDDLCHTAAETEHWGIVSGDKYHFACFYDAVILATLLEQPVEIRTRSPAGDVIEARADGSDDLSVNPSTAVFSFGIDNHVHPPTGDEPTLETAYAAICPFVNAFPNRQAYEGWTNSVPAETICMPLSGATELAIGLVK